MPTSSYDEADIQRRLKEREQAEQQFATQKQEEYDQMVGDAPTPKEGEKPQPAEPTTVNPLQSIPDTIQNLAQGAANLIGQGQQYQAKVQEAQQIQQERDKQLEEAQSSGAGFVASEIFSTVADAAAGTVESTLDTVDLLGDVARVGVNKIRGVETKATEDPWSDRYIAAAYDFGVKGPKTQVGQFASKLLQFAVITRAAATRLPKILITLGTKGVGLKGAIASGLVPGAIADFILTDKEDGNLSAMANNFMPEDSPLRDSFLFALRSDENDDIFTAKLKGTLEGGVAGAAADSLLWLMWGRKAAQKALSEGATQEEALAVGLKETDAKMKEVDKNDTKFKLEEQARFDEYNSEELQELLGVRQRMEAQMAAYRASGITESDPKFQSLMESLDDVNLNIAEVDEKLMRGYDPNDIKGIDQQDVAAYNKPADAQMGAEQHMTVDMPPKGVVNNPYAKDYVSIEGDNYHMLTDAQYKVMQYRPEQEELIRKFSGEIELQRMANKLKRPVADIIAHAARALDDFRGALANDVPASSLEDLMNQYGLLDPKSTMGSKLLSKEGVLVTKVLIGDTASQIHKLSKNAMELRANGQPVGNQMDRAIDRLVTLLEFHKTTAYETGSKLEMFSRNLEATIQSGDARNLNKGLDLSVKEVREWATNVKAALRRGDPGAMEDMTRLVNSMVLAGGDPSKQVKFFNAFLFNTAKNFTNGMYQSLLSGPITHLRNAMGNTYSLVERPFSAYMQGVFGRDKQVRDSAVAGMHAIFTGFGDAFKIAKTTFKTQTSANFNTKFAVEDFQTKAMIEQMKAAANTKNEKVFAGILEKHYQFLNNPWLSWPSNALIAGDDFFKSLAARYRMYSKAKFEALQHTAPGESVDYMMDQYLKKFSQGIDNGTGRILDQDLLNYTERVTFQQDPGSFMNSIAAAVDAMPLGTGRLFMPFIRTPGNLFGYGLEHLPGANHGLRQFDATYQAAKKNGDRILMAEMEGRWATGTILATSLVATAMFTDITGNYPANSKERSAWKVEGRPPFSVKVGNQWVSYASVEPVNSFLGVTADLVRLWKMGAADFAERAMTQFAYSITAAYTDKSFLGGLTDIGELLSPQNLRDPSGFRFALNAFNNYMPYSGARRAFSNAFDPYIREVQGEIDRVLKGAAPGFSNGMHASTSWVTGKALLSQSGNLFNAVSPIRVTAVNEDYVTQQLTDIGYATNNVTKYGEYGVKLLPRHKEGVAKIMHELGVGKRLEKLMRSKEWQALKKAYKGRSFEFTDVIEGKSDLPPHIQQVANIINQGKRTALARLRKNDESYLMLVATEKYKQEQAGIGNFDTPTLKAIRQYAGLD